jgi:protein SCO1
MKKNFLGWTLLVLVLLCSVLIMVLPTLFTKGVSRVELHQTFDLPLILDSDKEVELLFFGYSGCSDICTPRLASISYFYAGLDKKLQSKIGVRFVDISSPEDRTLPQRFAKFFHRDFKGIYLDKATLRDYTKEFSVFFAPSLMDDFEYEHTTNLYLVKKELGTKEISYVYSAYPYDFKQIELDIKELSGE